jgi:hypothetical protein
VSTLALGALNILFGLYFAIWPERFQAVGVESMGDRSDFFAKAWKSKATTITIRLIGVGAVILGSLAIAKGAGLLEGL